MNEQNYFNKDYYKTLGLKKDASEQDIKKAFRKLSRQYHPDKNPNNKAAEEKFKEITEAHTVLGNQQEREKYDQIRAMAGGGPRFAAGGGNGGFQDFFGGGAPFGGGTSFRSSGGSYGGGGFGGINLDDILSSLGGGGGFGSSNGFQQAAPTTPSEPQVDKTIKISFKNAIFGAKVKHRFKDGSEVTFIIPAGTNDGKIFLVKSPSGKKERVKVTIKVPDATKLTEPEQQKLKDALTFLR
ncbi:MAG: DnaJ domain-containing protein [Candidatus Ancillula sp.]|jgi:molecular chaperone DnaJ|nr:DnaJ domain-containing protein [Candidatus Ancillula sp.]